MSFFELVFIFLKASMLSSGSLQALPLLQEDLLLHRQILSDADFAKAVSIGRIAPGPSGLFALSIGYFAAGFGGVLAALIGITLPPFFGIGLVKAHRRLAGQGWVVGATRGVTATTVGLLAAVGYSFTSPLLASPASVVIVVVALVILVRFKTDALPLIVAAGAAGALLYALGIPLA